MTNLFISNTKTHVAKVINHDKNNKNKTILCVYLSMHNKKNHNIISSI